MLAHQREQFGVALDAEVGFGGPEVLTSSVVVEGGDSGAATGFEVVAEVADHHGGFWRSTPSGEQLADAIGVGLGSGLVAA